MLALIGSGEYLAAVDPIDKELLARLPEAPVVVCLPTAAGREGAAVVSSWMQKGIDHFTRLGAAVTAVPVIDAASAHDPAHAAAVRGANFVYLSGGHPGYLYDCLHGSPVWAAIMAVHARGGVVAGCSAGAMIMGAQIMGPGGKRPGFSLLPGTVIIPHFDEWIGPLSRLLRAFGDRRQTMVGIDGRTALLVADGRFTVLGRRRVTVFTGNQRLRFGPGPIPEGLLASRQDRQL